jgi:hypothetical protein
MDILLGDGRWSLVAGCSVLITADGAWRAAFINDRREQAVTGFWSLVTGYWLLVTGYWLLVTGYWLLVTGYW